MVEKKAWLPVYSSPRPGGTPAANGFHQVSTSEHALVVNCTLAESFWEGYWVVFSLILKRVKQRDGLFVRRIWGSFSQVKEFVRWSRRRGVQ